MLRVYWMCPGQSAITNLRVRGRRVAVGDVDRDALFALGAQAVGDEGEVDLTEAAAFRCRLLGSELIVEELTGVEEQPADEGALAVVDRSDRGGGDIEEWPGQARP